MTRCAERVKLSYHTALSGSVHLSLDSAVRPPCNKHAPLSCTTTQDPLPTVGGPRREVVLMLMSVTVAHVKLDLTQCVWTPSRLLLGVVADTLKRMSDVKIKGQAPVQSTDAEYREVKVSPTGDLATYSAPAPLATKLDEASASVTYIGKAKIGSASASALWQIQKMSVSGNVTSITWADSDSLFNNIWDDRAGLTYG
jgi:hypothetical protein